MCSPTVIVKYAGLFPKRVQLLLELVKAFLTRSRPHINNDRITRAKSWKSQAENLADEPLETIADDGATHLTRHRNP